MGKKTLEFAYFFLMIFGKDYVIHINDDNDSSSFSCVLYKQSVVRLILGVTKPLYNLGKTIILGEFSLRECIVCQSSGI